MGYLFFYFYYFVSFSFIEKIKTFNIYSDIDLNNNNLRFLIKYINNFSGLKINK